MSVSVLSVFAQVPVGSNSGMPPGGPGGEVRAIRGEIKDARQEVRGEVRDIRGERREDVKDIRTETRGDIKDIRTEARNNSSTKPGEIRQRVVGELQGMREGVKAVRMEARVGIEAARTKFLDTVKEKRELIKTKLEANREVLQKRIQNFKDERKKQVAVNVGENLGKVNENATNGFTKALDQMSDVLGRISSRADKAEDNSIDVSVVRAEILNASSAIATARAAVLVQAGKTYSVTISGEDKLKDDLGAVRKTLRDDLEKARDLVKAAREAVRKAATVLAQIPRINEVTIPTSTIESSGTVSGTVQ